MDQPPLSFGDSDRYSNANSDYDAQTGLTAEADKNSLDRLPVEMLKCKDGRDFDVVLAYDVVQECKVERPTVERPSLPCQLVATTHRSDPMYKSKQAPC